MQNGAITPSITTPSIKGLYVTLSIKGLYVTLSITMIYHYAECHIRFMIMLNIIMLSVVAPRKTPSGN